MTLREAAQNMLDMLEREGYTEKAEREIAELWDGDPGEPFNAMRLLREALQEINE